MNIDIDEKEARVLLTALHAYRSYLHNEAEELAALDAARAEKKYYGRASTYPPVLGCGCIDFPEQKVKIPYYKDDEFCKQIRDKLKKHQMMFPLEEQKLFDQNWYDKRCFG